MEPANLAPVRENSMLCYGPLVSELGEARVHGAPNPVIGGACAPPGSAAYGYRTENKVYCDVVVGNRSQ